MSKFIVVSVGSKVFAHSCESYTMAFGEVSIQGDGESSLDAHYSGATALIECRSIDEAQTVAQKLQPPVFLPRKGNPESWRKGWDDATEVISRLPRFERNPLMPLETESLNAALFVKAREAGYVPGMVG